MQGMRDEASGDHSPDERVDRNQMHLQCIGSFYAWTQDGERHTIELWTHFAAVHDRERIRVQPSILVLTTTEGRGVERVDQGQYRLIDNPEVSLSSNDPEAP
jgi:hypothetical protein